jgi:hypothetical protein
MDFKLRAPNSELKTIFQRKLSFDETLSRLVLMRPFPSKVLFWGDGVGGISSYAAGWMAGHGMDVILLDGANRFDPYTVSFFARSLFISPETLLKKIRMARAFTCYQMATLMGEKLVYLIRREKVLSPGQEAWVILLGPITTFLDEDVPEREVRPLFERALKRVEELAAEKIPFLIFETPVHPRSKRSYLMKRLFRFSDLVWKIEIDGQGPKMILEKGLTQNISENCKLQNGNCKVGSLPQAESVALPLSGNELKESCRQ